MPKSVVVKILLFLYIIGVAGLSVFHFGESDIAFSDIVVIDLLRLDYLLHALVFIPLVPLWRLALPGHPWWLVIISGLLFAACCEGIHFLLPYRSYNINDLLGNMVGVILGAMAARWLLPLFINRY